ncbi:MAG: class II aldolase/adducin family protein [Candidatus Muirbacterium halophilum]|nr:class II aldolase/adducin family protein [Candidatus Muirbacterium halophilum]MCK9475363.1 class II aldolase/adducin family protein [Candidatus Muirbacterium halophilum]
MFIDFYKEFVTVGHELFLAGLNNFHSGNISSRKEDNIVITSTGSKLGFLKEENIICLPIFSDESGRASCELPVHRAIYKATNAKAIVHAHAPYSVALSYFLQNVKPIDGEGMFYFPDGVEVLTVKNSVASEEVAEKIPDMLVGKKAVIVKGHGIFAIGEDVVEAAKWVSSIENSSKIVYLVNNYKGIGK